MSSLSKEVESRRTFAIISHPDAGKTTLTEKLLLLGGAIQTAGAVKARGAQRRAHSDWMKVERERGISVASSVMTYSYDGHIFNLLDTPGHQDFSEDTYRTLTAVDSAVMVIDCAKGIENQTLKLFEVCRLRDMPIITFVNKLDRDSRDPFDLLDEIEQKLALDVTPASWPIGSGRGFKGCYDLLEDHLVLINRTKGEKPETTHTCDGLDDPKLDELLGETDANTLREEVEMARGLCPEFDMESFREGHLSPVFFGSALNSFGVRELLDGVAAMAPQPQPQPSADRLVDPMEEKVTGFVFKIQANMDPKHRDRIAFVRICSGQFKRGMKLKHMRSGKLLNVHNPVLFLAQDRELAEEAWPGDIIGIPNHGNLRIGDTLTETEDLQFSGVPSFAPELLQRARPDDPLKAKHLGRALQQLAEEGAASVFKPDMGADWIVGVVGGLQFEVMADRIRTEYNVPVHFEATELYTARWVRADDAQMLKKFIDANKASVGKDHDGETVFMARNAWQLDRAQEDWPDVKFLKVREQST
ncbi:MAG: peptide chain release factor 3 [Rhodospirillales bacterium]|jgi:peptide chain release factor 3|nr:peptide chain release factor 3 [Rhodospirillales bacterium]MBT4039594.1 peptide chain release factor 3 [Rhodospirillales bacterium]MBT4625306.1 peptide chain release factor 3 [Rhodospirillales bacterium]MBT5353254.1 peptide chain release factor 3 [Rhodospirillales bacterium]MBT5520238.1 peptide chain release factor 3 [Rhodospirillales bacterium]